MKITACFKAQLAVIIYLLFSTSPHATETTSWHWNCSIIQTSQLYKNKVTWQTLNCDGYLQNIKILKSLNINVIYAPINDPEIQFVPYRAQTPTQLAKLPDIAASLPQYNVLAGINGGYFYRIDQADFKDNICLYKTHHPPKPGDSMGDSLLQYNGMSYATNCAFIPGIAQNPRASLILTGVNPQTGKPAPYITLVKPDMIYKQPNDVIPDAIGAGPNLVTNGKLTVNNPDENLIPTLEFAANAAIGIINNTKGDPTQLVLFTVDGNDKSFEKNWPGMNASQMADFMLHYLKVSNAISMDQGGSTTAFVSASDLSIYPLHVVSNANYEPGVPRSANNVREIYDGLFIATK